MPRVICRAAYCAHNMGGEICNAAVIEVNGDERYSRERTDCSTFISRDFSGSLLPLENVNYAGLVAQAFTGLHTADPEIRCAVDVCRYHKGEEKCGATAVEIQNDNALSSSDTYCDTFVQA